MPVKTLIIRSAGINCDKETEFAFSRAKAETDLLHINYVKERNNLIDYQIICIPGGFSYGDDLGAGKIFSLEFTCWLGDHLRAFIDRGGLILGICNGFQVLVKSGILPDLDFKQKVTLALNQSGRFEDRWVYLKVESKSVWFKDFPQLISLPVAHGEGKFYAERRVLGKIESGGQVALRYCDSALNLAGYPFNPNGSLENIAGITDLSGRVLGLMPHPERNMFRHHSPFWKDREVSSFGEKFFENAVAYFK
jgi:phosphoribosylformylglycinamidine synthase